MTITEQSARQHLKTLVEKYDKLPQDERRQITEDGVIRQFIDILLRDVLGWPIEDPARYKYELHTQAGRPDITLLPENGGTIFVEAKKFGIIKQLEQARYTIAGTILPGQLALPGMSVDRTPEEQQAINYAFDNGGTWAILTNFEKLRLFNARRDWLVLSFEEPSAYLHDFDLLWQLAYPNVLKGSLDDLSKQRHMEEVDSVYLSFINEWREKLARDIVQHLDTNRWATLDDGRVNLLLLRSVVQRFLDRLVIIRFAEDHLVIPPGTLRELYDVRKSNPYTFSMDQFLDQFFRKFDAQHNSALFAEGVVDEAEFSDDVLLPLVGKLYEARYRAMPADILGNTYEQYLGKALVIDNGDVKTRDNLETRKKQGSYYTPQVIVRYIVDNSLGRYLYGTKDGCPDGEPVDGEGRKTAADIIDLRVLDSACGSGSFLIYAYYVLEDFYRAELERLETEAETRRQALVAGGMTSPLDLAVELTPYTAERDRIRDYPRLILEHHLYGVDLDPQAAEIAVVNLMMRAMEGRHREKRLPLILNQNVKVGNSLIGLRPDDSRLADYQTELATIRQLRADLIRVPQGEEHDQIIRDLETATNALNDALNPDFAAHFNDLTRVRPFHWAVEFPEVFYDPAGDLKPDGGFTLIFGNPPWEIVKPDLREFYAQFDERIESRLNRRQVEKRIDELNAEDPRRKDAYEQQVAYIEASAAYYRQTADYTRQGRGDTATHKLFTERMYGLLHDSGRLGYVVPSGIYSDLGTKELREMFFEQGRITHLCGIANVMSFFSGVDSRFKFTLLGVQKGILSDSFPAMFLISHADWARLNIEDASQALAAVLDDKDRIFNMSTDIIRRFNPQDMTVMEFQSQIDFRVSEKIYADRPLLGDDIDGLWGLDFAYEFHMSGDSHLFRSIPTGKGISTSLRPLYEGKMIHQFDPFYAEPRFWLDSTQAQEKLNGSKKADWHTGYRFAFREIARATDERTCIATILPPNTYAGHTLWVGIAPDNAKLLFYVALANSFCVDWLVRFKAGTHVTLFLMKSLPIPRLTASDPFFDAIVPRAARLTCTRPEFADLWADVMGEAWDESSGAIDPAERQVLRDEIDALVAHLYGLTRAEFDHILGTFPLVFPDSDAGRARRETLLGVYAGIAPR